MSEELHRKAILENSKTLKDLTKSINTLNKTGVGNSSDDSSKADDGSVGPVGRRLDSMLDSVKNAFENNTTVKFLSDPASVIGKGMKGLFDPITNGFNQLGGFFKKPFEMFKGLGGNKIDKKFQEQNISLLTDIKRLLGGELNFFADPKTLLGVSKDDFSGSLEEATGRQLLQFSEAEKKRLAPLANFTKNVKLLPQMIMGTAFNKLFDKEDGVMSKLFGPFTKLFKKPEDKDEKVITLTAYNGEVLETINDSIHGLHFTMGDLVRMIIGFNEAYIASTRGLPSPKELALEQAKATGREIAKIEGNKDQALREEKKDGQKFQLGLFKGLGASIKSALGIGGGRGGKDPNKPTKGGIFGWIKKNILGIGAGTVAAGTAAAVGGIGGFFTGLTAIMKGVGTAFPFYAKGAAALSLLALPLLAFGLTLPMLTKGLEGFNKEKLGLFAGVITTVGLIAAGLGALIATGVGGLALAGGIAAIAGLGLAIGGFGKGIEVGQKGFDVLTNFFKSLGATPDIGDKISQVGGLGGALAKIGGGGILSRFSSGPLDKVSDFLDKAQGNTLPATAEGLNRLAVGMAAVSAIELDTDFSKAFKDFSKYTFREDLRKAGDGFASFLKKVNEQLKKLDTSKLETLLQTAEIDLNSINNQGFVMESGARAMSNNSQQGMGFTQVDNSTRSGDQNVSVVNQHIGVVNDDTLRMVAP